MFGIFLPVPLKNCVLVTISSYHRSKILRKLLNQKFVFKWKFLHPQQVFAHDIDHLGEGLKRLI